MSLSRNHEEEGTRNILRTMQFTSKHTDTCLDNCHVILKIYLLCPCLYLSYFCLQRSSWMSKHQSVRLFRDGVLIGSMIVSILLRQTSYQTSPVRFYVRVRHTRSRGNVINYKGLRAISIYRYCLFGVN